MDSTPRTTADREPRALVACDLDGTIIYPRRHLGSRRRKRNSRVTSEILCVEYHRRRPTSFVSRSSVSYLTALTKLAIFVPATTRTVEQYVRIRFPWPTPRYAVCANGAHLLINGVPDPSWAATMRGCVAVSAIPLPDMVARVRAMLSMSWPVTLKIADQMFLYLLSSASWSPEPNWVSQLRQETQDCGWTVFQSGRKTYLMPHVLTKSAAVTELRQRLGMPRLLAAGDSLLDRNMLLTADAGIYAAHGELAALGPAGKHLVQTAAHGLTAGTQIARWLHANVRVSCSTTSQNHLAGDRRHALRRTQV